MSSTDRGGNGRAQKTISIVEALDGFSDDILNLIYKIVFFAESGLE
jgi:hypothetical protein